MYLIVTQSCRVGRGTSAVTVTLTERDADYQQNLTRPPVAHVPPFHRIL